MGKVKSDKNKKRKAYFKEWRLYRKYKQWQVAEHLGVTGSAISQLENGDINYTQPMLEALADFYGCEPVELLIRDPKDPQSPFVLWDSMTPSQRKQAVAVWEALKSSS